MHQAILDADFSQRACRAAVAWTTQTDTILLAAGRAALDGDLVRGPRGS